MFHANLVTTTAKTIKDFTAYKTLKTDEKSIKVKIMKFEKCSVCGKECLADNEISPEQEFKNEFRENVFNFMTSVSNSLKQQGLKKVSDIPETIVRHEDKKFCARCKSEFSA